MAALPQTTSTMLNSPPDETSTAHANIDDLTLENQSTNNNREPNSYSIRPIENDEGKQSNSSPMIPFDQAAPGPLLLELPVQHTNDDIVVVQTVPVSDACSPEQSEQSTESQSFIVANPTSSSHENASSGQSIETGSSTSVSYGVEWSDRVRPTSHCWFSFTSTDASTAQSCIYATCPNLKSKHPLALLQCGSCDIVIHSHHLNNVKSTEVDLLPICRPSFVENQKSRSANIESENNPPKYDRHFWSQVNTLPKPCTYCQRTSKPNNLFGSGTGRSSPISSLDIVGQLTSAMSALPGNFSPKMSKPSRGLICLWCSRGYHESCWQQLAEQDDMIHCDYGILRDIIVRPQWLSRSSTSKLGFQARLPAHPNDSNAGSSCLPYTPVIMFINKRSGGQVGEKIYRELLKTLNPRQVFLLENNATITNALEIYSSLPNIRICVFGGDGTVGWILGCLAENYPSRNNPPVSICPLGTGNDLSRVLAWGEQYDSKNLFNTMLRIPQAQVVALDRWAVQVEKIDVSISSSSIQQQHANRLPIVNTLESLFKHPKFVREDNRALYENHQQLPNTRFINYMSFGLDAAITLDFHDERTRDPSKFSSPLKNKLMYLNESCKYLSDFVRANIWDLSSYIRLICDGRDLTDAIRECHTLVILNIPGYASGTNPWGKSSSRSFISYVNNYSMDAQKSSSVTVDNSTNPVDVFSSLADTHENVKSDSLNKKSAHETSNSAGSFECQDFGDRKIEVLGLNTGHMATIHVGFCGYRIAQCSQLRIELSSPMTAQMDGEPFYLPATVAVNISHADQVLVLKNQSE
ncbi:unnamed protein product [Rotaria socialis]|uniref:Diacylglycerol kinase n=2 Tax=Rotaria socialis TaxID=392032 RepID=A0A817SF04_9BILA|nr:unnamed protein product [Rotaria socialis]CAF3296280.1 unnamed protein product [Rotaria socialis]CAF4217071.1 unnamed protein product [Rotaria socialis]CAF4281933.1 unnamed protein product [Rotaria socialis]